MASKYYLIKDFFDASTQSTDPAAAGEEVSTSPYWLVAVFRLNIPLTFSRKTMTSIATDNDSVARTVKGPPLLIAKNCVHLQVESHKSSHISTLQASILPGATNYLLEILPGDWLMAWMVNDKGTYDSLLSRLSGTPLKPCNGFMDGLKFVGRASGVRKHLALDPQGKKTMMFSLFGNGFKELDAGIFYDARIARAVPGIAEWMVDVNLALTSLLDENSVGVAGDKMIPALLDLLLGSGVPANAGQGAEPDPDTPPAMTGLTSSPNQAAPYAYLVPKDVGTVLNRHQDSKGTGVLSYADILDSVIGIQNFNSQPGNAQGALTANPAAIFTPNGIPVGASAQAGFAAGALAGSLVSGAAIPGSTRKKTGTPISGTFVPDQLIFDNRTVWTLLNQYLNQVINEMYTTLRVNENNEVSPTLVVRQIPFSTELYAASDVFSSGGTGTDSDSAPVAAPAHTTFQELPRWVMDPRLIWSYDIGRSDEMRLNFFHVYGTSDMAGTPDISFQIFKAHPVADGLDIKANGMRPYVTSIAVAPQDVLLTYPKIWMSLIADMHMGMTLSLSGQLTSVGIQAPIAVGDNLEFDDTITHIEGIIHICGFSGTKKFFTTQLMLTNGLRAETASMDETGLGLYTGTQTQDLTQYDPGLTDEGGDIPPQKSRAVPPPPSAFGTSGATVTDPLLSPTPGQALS